MNDTALAHPGQTLTLAELAGRINAEHAACAAAMKDGLRRARQAGLLLIEAKALCPHGEWLPWLCENFNGSPRSAQTYMRVADRWPELESKSAGSALLSLDDAVKLLAAPKEGPDPAPDKEYLDPRRHPNTGRELPHGVTWHIFSEEGRPDPAGICLRLPDRDAGYLLSPCGAEAFGEMTEQEFLDVGDAMVEWYASGYLTRPLDLRRKRLRERLEEGKLLGDWKALIGARRSALEGAR